MASNGSLCGDRAATVSAAFWFGRVDLLPLSLMRVTFGVATLWSTIALSPVLFPLFSDAGVMPIGSLLSKVARINRVSLFDIARPDWLLVALYVMTLAALVCFTIGYRTRLSSVLSFILLTGLYERNLYAVTGASEIYRVVLFWLMFLPCGQHISFDSFFPRSKAPVSPAAGGAFRVRLCQAQIAWIYLSGGLYKLDGASWRSGEAVHIALGAKHVFTRSLGDWMFQYPVITSWVTYYTIAVELAFALLMFWPFVGQSSTGSGSNVRSATKAVGLVLGCGLHVGLLASLKVQYFSLGALASYPIFFEAGWLRRSWIGHLFWLPVRAEADSACWQEARCGSSMGHLQAIFARIEWSFVPWRTLGDAGLLLVLVASCVNRAPPQLHVSTPAVVSETVEELELWQQWNMGAPDPLAVDFYLRGEGTLRDGTHVDALQGIVPEMGQSYYWTEYLKSIAFGKDNSPWTAEFGRYICRTWNGLPLRGETDLVTFNLYREEQKIPLSGEILGPWIGVEIWNHHCF